MQPLNEVFGRVGSHCGPVFAGSSTLLGTVPGTEGYTEMDQTTQEIHAEMNGKAISGYVMVGYGS